MTTIQPVRKQVTVNATQQRAFDVFTQGMDRWWPRQHHIGTSPMKQQVLETKAGGRWYAVSQDGSVCNVGKVLTWDPPKRLVLAWQITGQWQFDPSFVTEVEVQFIAVGPKQTRVEFEHRNLEKYGVTAVDIRGQLDADGGWTGTLVAFARTAGQPETPAAKFVMFYETAADGMDKASANYPAHRARLDQFHARGVLLMAGPWANPTEGAMGIFTSREAVEEFIKDDPFVTSGAVAKWTIREFRDALM